MGIVVIFLCVCLICGKTLRRTVEEKCMNRLYGQAKQALQVGNNLLAYEKLKSLGDFKDSNELLKTAEENIYISAITKFNQEKYENAQKEFKVIVGYKDSKFKIKQCSNGIELNDIKEKCRQEDWLEAFVLIYDISEQLTEKKKVLDSINENILMNYNDITSMKTAVDKYRKQKDMSYKKAAYLYGLVEYDSGQYVNAIQDFEKCQFPSSSKKLLYDSYYKQGIKMMKLGNLDMALENFGKVSNESYSDLDKYISICKKYVKFSGTWMCKEKKYNYLFVSMDIKIDTKENVKILGSFCGIKKKINCKDLLKEKIVYWNHSGIEECEFNFATKIGKIKSKVNPSSSGSYRFSNRNEGKTYVRNRNQQKTNLKEKPEIGMTEEEVYNTKWGRPYKVNVTETKYGVNKQLCYNQNRYVYTDNGKVTAIQY